MRVNLTMNQILLIFVAICSALAAGSATLTDIFNAQAAKTIVGVANLLNTIIVGIVASLSGQASLVRAVQGMPGVEKIQVNDKANRTLAALAVDEDQPKIEPIPGSTRIVNKIAEGTAI